MVPNITTEDVDKRLRTTYNNNKNHSNANEYSYHQYSSTTDPTTGATLGAGMENPQSSSTNNIVKQQQQLQSTVKKNNNGNDDDDFEDDSDFDDDFNDDDDDDPAVVAFRNKRLQELKLQQVKHAENVAKGHGEYRTITQDEFLPECNTSGDDSFVVIHFYHDLFERCKIMDHHINKIVQCKKYISTCKFLRINAEKCPFFVTKLQIQTLPTLLIFQNGKTIHRLIGFEGLTNSNSKKKNKSLDEWPTKNLKLWLASTGAINYNPNDDDESDDDDGSDEEEESATLSKFRRLGMQARYNKYDEDA